MSFLLRFSFCYLKIQETHLFFTGRSPVNEETRRFAYDLNIKVREVTLIVRLEIAITDCARFGEMLVLDSEELDMEIRENQMSISIYDTIVLRWRKNYV